MTPEEAKGVASYIRLQASRLPFGSIQMVTDLREAADIIEAAAAPPQPATVEPRLAQIRCELCRFYETERGSNSDLQVCKRYPQHVVRRKDDVCGEFMPEEVTP